MAGVWFGFGAVGASAVEASLSWKRRSYIVLSLTWRWPSASCFGVAGSALHGEGDDVGSGGVGNRGVHTVAWWRFACIWLGLWMVHGDSPRVNVGLCMSWGRFWVSYLLLMKVHGGQRFLGMCVAGCHGGF